MRDRNSGNPGGVFSLKIALVSPYDFSYKGGVVSHVVSLGNELSSRGHNVKILAPCSDPEQVETGEVELISFGRSVPVPSAGSISPHLIQRVAQAAPQGDTRKGGVRRCPFARAADADVCVDVLFPGESRPRLVRFTLSTRAEAVGTQSGSRCLPRGPAGWQAA